MRIDEFFITLRINADTQKLTAAMVAIAQAAQKMVDDAAKVTVENSAQAGFSLKSVVSVATGAITAISQVGAGLFAFIDKNIAGAKALAKQKTALFAISQNELVQADRYRDALNKTGLSLQSIKTKLALGLAPILTETIARFNAWLLANKDLIATGLTQLVKWVGYLAQIIVNAVRFVDLIVSATMGWKAALLVLVSALAVVKRAMIAAFVTNPVGLVIAAVAGFLLLIDDLMVYLQGGDSLFAGFWQPAVAWVQTAIAWFMRWYDEVAAVFDAVSAVFSNMLNGLTTVLTHWFNYLKNLFLLIYGLFTGDIELIKAAWQGMTTAIGGMWQGVKETLTAVVDGIKSLFTGLSNVVSQLFMDALKEADQFITGVSQAFNAIIDAITAPFKAAFAEVVRVYDNTIGKLSGAVDAMKSGAGDIWTSVKSGLGLADNRAVAGPQATAGYVNQQATAYNAGDVNATFNIVTNDPQAAGAAVVQSLRNENQRATSYMATAVTD